jgi:hypothetical protein
MKIGIVAVAHDRSHAVAADGCVLEIVTMLDFEGDETQEASEATVVVAVHPSGKFVVIDLSDFTEKAAFH